MTAITEDIYEQLASQLQITKTHKQRIISLDFERYLKDVLSKQFNNDTKSVETAYKQAIRLYQKEFKTFSDQLRCVSPKQRSKFSIFVRFVDIVIMRYFTSAYESAPKILPEWDTYLKNRLQSLPKIDQETGEDTYTIALRVYYREFVNYRTLLQQRPFLSRLSPFDEFKHFVEHSIVEDVDI